MAKRSADKPIQSVAFVSLGCPKNLVDSERMLGLLAQDGLSITPDAAEADAIVINTCGFLEASKTESLDKIRQAIDLKKRGKCQRVIVAGCLVQGHKTKLLNDVPGVDRLVGVFDYRPTLYPQAWSIDAIIAQVLPLPLVPATSTERN